MSLSELDQALDFSTHPAYDDALVDQNPEAWERIDRAAEDSEVHSLLALAELPDVLHSYVSRAFVARS